MASCEYVERDAVLQILSGRNAPWDGYNAVKILPAADVVPRNAYNAIRWERDIMKKQLADIGKTLGQKMDDVQPVVHGEWINTRPIVEYKGFCQVKCSICESIEPYGNYCRNCGAKMDGEDDG